jgi:hypothetical protein
VQEEKVENRVKFQVETQEETQVKQPAAPITARKRKQSTSIATGILRSTTATPVNNNHVEPSSATANKRRSVRSASEASTVKFVSGNAAEDTAPRASSDRTSSSGLAPPPGFNRDEFPIAPDLSSADVTLPINTGAGESASLGDLLTAALNSDNMNPSLPFSQPVNTPRNDILFGAGLGESPAAAPVGDGDAGFRIHSSPPIGAIPASAETVRSGRSEDAPSPAGDPLLDVLLNDRDNSRNGFDVMDFLDGILDDGVANEQEGEQSSTPSSLLAGASDVPLTSNPWATEKKSRAAAYGINFDDSDSGLNAPLTTGDESGLASFPLLTPAAILMAGQGDDGDDDDDRALSFYARLTADEE